MNSRRRNILIGGSGFIGSALAEILLSQGERVVVVARDIPVERIEGVEYLEIDLGGDLTPLQGMLGKGDTVFLLIGQVYPGFDARKEKDMFSSVLEVVSLASPEKVLFASSALVYGDADIAVSEQVPLRPKDEYSVFKTECERMIHERLSHISVGVVRLGNVYGSEKNRGFIGLVFNKASDGTKMSINGDGLQERDYVFLDDVVSGMIAVRDKLSGFDIVNIATGTSSTLLDIIRLAENVVGKKIEYEVTGLPVNEVYRSRIDGGKLQREYGYKPRISISEGLQKTYDRYKGKY
ncbi:MAG: UDP-glucose 4-epimerase [Patescibacteria group bacterium]|nr:UDP-glucose 4-epimerase [Patescibacteria group bacterium]